MLVSGIFLVIIGIFGFIFNLVTLYITGYRLRFTGIDLMLMGFVAINDMVMSLMNVTRLLVLEVKWLNTLQDTAVWCAFDSTLMLSLSQNAIETIAVLSGLRYLAICYNKQFNSNFWIALIFISSASSLALSLGNIYYPNAYEWSNSGLYCLPGTNENAPNLTYFFSWYIIMVIRLSLSLIVISFSYYKILVSYRMMLEEQIVTIELEENTNSGLIYSFKSIPRLAHSNLNDQIQKQYRIISIQLLGIAIIYIIIVAPNEISHVYKIFTNNYPSSNIVAITEILYSTTIIINPLFVLVSHEPSRRELSMLFSQIFQSHGYFKNIPL